MKQIIFFFLFPFILFSQETKISNSKTDKENIVGKISGKVKSINDKSNLEFASVSLFKSNNKDLVEGTITDSKGRFIFKSIVTGNYILKISFIGFESKEIILSTNKFEPNFQNNNIYLITDSKLLEEINIKDEKAIYETRIDKIVYNAENDLNDAENDATDVLRKAPLLSVDLEGNVSLRGSKNIKFLVNGKASSFFSSDVSTALQMIPADQIKKVEVITSPGAKYEGEGDAGIVNIITKKTIIDGYNATLNTMIGSKVTRNGFSLNLGKGKFGLSSRANFYGSWPGRIGKNTYTRYDWENIIDNDTINLNQLFQNGKTENYYQGYRGSLNAYYDFNDYNSINSSLSFGGRTSPSKKENSVNYINSTVDSLSYLSDYLSDKTDRSLNIEWTTDYTKKFKDNDERELSFAIQLGGDINDGNTIIDENINSILRSTYNQNDEKVIEETFQVDYSHPLGKSKSIDKNSNDSRKNNFSNKAKGKKWRGKKSNSNKIELGVKIINRDREMVYSNQLNNIYKSSEKFDYNQHVISSYVSTEISMKKGFGLKTGVRYENTQSSGNWKNNSESPFKNNYDNLLPSFVISKSFSPMRSIKFSYNQRIRRPSVRNINTNENFDDSRNFTVGNPQLKPTRSEQYEFTLNSFGKILQGSTQLYYKHSNDVIESFLDTIQNGSSISTYKNIGETRQLGISFFGSMRLNKLTLRGSFDLYNYSGKDISLGYEEWTESVVLYSYYFGGSYNLGKNWKAETFGFFRSPTQTIQGTSTSFSMISFGVNKAFKNKRGSIGIRIIEPFNKNKIFETDLSGEFFSQSSITTTPFRSFGISFKYTFGKLNFKDSKKKTNINNDDISEQQQEM
ncbi:MAG: TonB-dependent receptor [Flavobacteriales bacterium]|nr:TonB-dependent receptor [Flavobacteriales bacterium]